MRQSSAVQAFDQTGSRDGRRQTVGRFGGGYAKQYDEAGTSQGVKLMRYAIVIEKVGGNYSAYVPALPGCVATGTIVPEVEAEIRAAIRFHIDGLRQDGQPVPEPTSIADYVEA